MIFVTTCGKDYGRPWIFPSLGMLSCRVACLLESGDDRPLPVNVERIPYAGDRYYQAGQFLDSLPLQDDSELLVMADADAIVQRDFDADELATFDRMSGVALGYNMRPGQQGRHELELLQPKMPLAELGGRVRLSAKSLEDCPMYNTGLMVARVKVWRRLLAAYEGTVGAAMSRAGEMFFCYAGASMQYFICCVLHEYGIPVTELGYVTHSHGHFGLTGDHTIHDRKLYYRGRLVFFPHFVGGVCC